MTVRKYAFDSHINGVVNGNHYDYIKIYNHIKPNENIIRIVSDGEGVALHVSEVY